MDLIKQNQIKDKLINKGVTILQPETVRLSFDTKIGKDSIIEPYSVIGKNVTLRDLMGIQKEFYRKIGLTKVKFWPTFFPYTEPSLQTMVYNEKLGKWVELFGMGIFRPEVTKPLGITKPVLAWGGGIERIAMLKHDLDDVREFYNNNLNWLRTV